MKLEELSMLAFLSPSHFCRLFKEYTGLTVSEYTQRLRIEEACRLLKMSDKKVIDVAADVGYKDIKHFNQVFKKIIGKTPRDYRKQ
jgi:AraC family L-rhamnose operon transcriptional activator RhaR